MRKKILTIVLAVLSFGSLLAQAAQTGSIVGWGRQVVGVDTSAGFIAIAAGYGHSLGIKDDGSVAAWGENGEGECNVGAPNSGFIAIAAGYSHSLGLKDDGSVAAWGNNYSGQCNVPAPNSGFVAIAAGTGHSLGLKDDGSVAAWGDNGWGQCDVPTPNSGFIAIAAGDSHSLGLKVDGSVVAWGIDDGSYWDCGQVRDTPAGTDFIAIAAGGWHSLGLKVDGSVAAWGANWYGQCNVPAPNSGFIVIAAGRYHSLGLKVDGSVAAWGSNWEGQCNVPDPNGFIAIAAGGTHSLGLKDDGSVAAWGWNIEGQCNVPAPNSGFVAIAAGRYHSLGLKVDDPAGRRIVAWGYNSDGQCNVPAPNSGFIAIAAGSDHSLALKDDGPAGRRIAAWGRNEYGQCNVPAPNSDFIAIAAGYYHSLGLKVNGSVAAWGDNGNGQCNVPMPNSGFIAIAAGYQHSLGLKDDGSVAAWGYNTEGQCNVPAPNSGFVAIAAGGGPFGGHSLGLKVDGPAGRRIVAWGCNHSGQCNVPAPNSGFTAIAAGYYHSLGLKPCLNKPIGDINNDGRVDLFDFALMAANWLTGAEVPAGEIIVNLSMDESWMYQNLPGQILSNLTANVSIIDDPAPNSSYTYLWEFVLPDDITVEPATVSGGQASDTSWKFAAPNVNQPQGLSDSGRPLTVKVTVTGVDYANTGSAEVQFGIALLADVNNDKVVNVDDRSIINAFWQTGAAGSFTLNDCDVNSDDSVNVADRSIANAVWRGQLGQSSVSSPCPFRGVAPGMVFIPGGEFEMGMHFAPGGLDEGPLHAVLINSFFMSTCEITNQQYCDYLNDANSLGQIKVGNGIVYAASDSGNSYPYCDTHSYDTDSQIDYSGGVFSVRTKGGRDMQDDPMIQVSWYGAVAYCDWRGDQEGYDSCYNLSTWDCDFTKKGYRLATEAEWEYAARGGEHDPYGGSWSRTEHYCRTAYRNSHNLYSPDKRVGGIRIVLPD